MIKLLLLILITIQAFVMRGQDFSLEQNRRQIPVLKYKSLSPILQFKVVSAKELRAEEIVVEFEGTTDVNDIDTVYLIGMKSDSSWSTQGNDFIRKSHLIEGNVSFTFSPTIQIANNYFILAVKLSDAASLHHKVSVGLKKIQFADVPPILPEVDPNRIQQRIGVAVRKGGDDNVARYRIPGLAKTKDNSLLAIYDVRRDQGRDLQGDIDIGVSRSTDSGNTWESMCIALDMGEYGGLPQKYNGVSDACILVNQNNDDLYIAGCWMHGVIDEKTGRPIKDLDNSSNQWNHQWRHNGSLPGYDIVSTSQFLITKSDDDGKTWGPPINITKQIKKKEWHLFAPAPGSGITLDDGTLVFPTQGKDENQLPFSNITYSKDNGRTWQSTKPSHSNTTENMVVQLSDGSIMQNMRDNRNRTDKSDSNGRAIFVTPNLGEDWQEHPTNNNALVEPVCMASLYKHNYTTINGEQKSILLFSNPNSKYNRERMTIKVSFDDGNTWPEENWLLLDELGFQGGYSSLTSINNNTVGILYEGSQAQMTFESIGLEELKVYDADVEN